VERVLTGRSTPARARGRQTSPICSSVASETARSSPKVPNAGAAQGLDVAEARRASRPRVRAPAPHIRCALPQLPSITPGPH